MQGPGRTIPGVMLEAAERFGDASALEDGGASYTFAELAEAALGVAGSLVACGIEPGDRVAIWAPNRHEWVVAALGIQAAGGVMVGINPRFKGGEAAYALDKVGARLLFTVGEFLGASYVEMLDAHDLPALEHTVAFDAGVRGAEGWAEFRARAGDADAETVRARLDALSPEQLSDLIFTSGTTGFPKAVMTAHGQNVRAFENWADVVGLRAGDRYLVVGPFSHSFGYKAGFLACLLRGATILPHAIFDVPEILRRISEEKITTLPGAPTIYQSILAHPDRAAYDFSSLRLAVMGGAAVPEELVRRMRSELAMDTVITGYGLTESCGILTMCRYDDDPEIVASSCGRAIDDVEVRCVDADGKEVPRGTPGEVVARGYNLMRGYWDDPEETADAIDAEGWLHTGDVAVMNEAGYLRITDRIKDMFICGGFNVYPAEIENQLFGSGDYAAVAVIGVPDERMGEVGMAYVVPAPDRTVTPEAVVAWCRANMANYKVPRKVRVVEELPLNASGKVSKVDLRAQAAEEA